METAVALSSGRSIGFVLDADSSLENRWAAVSSRLRRSGVDAPSEAPPGGFVGETSQYRARAGAWVMPDNRRDGTLERFLEDLVRKNDKLLPHAKASTRGVKDLGARFPEVLLAKLRRNSMRGLHGKRIPDCRTDLPFAHDTSATTAKRHRVSSPGSVACSASPGRRSMSDQFEERPSY